MDSVVLLNVVAPLWSAGRAVIFCSHLKSTDRFCCVQNLWLCGICHRIQRLWHIADVQSLVLTAGQRQVHRRGVNTDGLMAQQQTTMVFSQISHQALPWLCVSSDVLD